MRMMRVLRMSWIRREAMHFDSLYKNHCEEFITETTEGLLQGYALKARNGRTVIGFSGIPYAKPPIGALRFQDPEPPDKWDGIRQAQIYGNVCVQLINLIPAVRNIIIGNEDCLYLTVYTPKISSSSQYPVLVYFHGGAFAFGFGEIAHGPGFFMDHDVVLVTINYRLGSLGFLSMEDELLPGNFGLKDQNIALKWVQRNINNFGGNPNKVTIMGESAGGASVYYHMISPLSQGLYHGAISQSGTAFCPWAYSAPGLARKKAIKTADILGCPTDSTVDMVECLKIKHPYDIIGVHKNFIIWQNDPLTVFTPSPDPKAKNPFLPDEIHKLFPASVPWLTGCNNLEGLLKTAGFSVFRNSEKELEKQFSKLIPQILMYSDTSSNTHEVTNKLRRFYLDDNPVSSLTLRNFTEMVGDAWFVWPMIRSLKKHKGNNYVYYNTYIGKETLQSLFSSYRNVLNGTAHGDETLYLWDYSSVIEPHKGEDLKFSELLTKLWVNFATNGTPTPSGFEFAWPIWTAEHNKYVIFSNKGISEAEPFLEDRMNFWDKLNERDIYESK
ncbi:esterase FE4-like [Rhodnius prolixus]|uniref:esterase FE4-like n=1 Tax=Rhodnius prolixus TaxID=13249 RepID=UPI003D18C08C